MNLPDNLFLVFGGKGSAPLNSYVKIAPQGDVREQALKTVNWLWSPSFAECDLCPAEIDTLVRELH